jgi:membrane-bound lytic murein transglycosylase D
MTHRAAVIALAALALAGCATTGPGPSSTVTTADTEAARALALCAAARERIDDLLEDAAAAAARGTADDAAGCEVALLAELARCAGPAASDPAMATYMARVLDDVAAIAEGADAADQAAGEVADLDGAPPEPLPVTPDQVAAERDKARAATYDLPVVVNAEVTSLIEFYTGSYRPRFAAAMERAGRLLPSIREELRRAGLPLDLAYLPFVESAFNTRARSRAKAQGLWQFMPGTGRLYGLRCDRLVDERNDPYLATKAAVAHLADLHAMFGTWELALAAYNSGPGRVQQALRRTRGTTDDFWLLRRHLPRETRNYVPALWAVLAVVKNPAAYGFAPIVEQPECLARIRVAGALDLAVLAERATVDVEQLADLNPALTAGVTPAAGSYQLAVPCGQEQRFAAVIAGIPHEQRVRSFTHEVQRGDTLAAIAARYGSSAEAISAANGVRDPRSLRIGQILVVPRQPGSRVPAARERRARAAATSEAAASRAAAAAPGPERYRVRHGDSLYSIARRFNLSVERLKDLNGLTGNLIKPGQWLRVVSM